MPETKNLITRKIIVLQSGPKARKMNLVNFRASPR